MLKKPNSGVTTLLNPYFLDFERGWILCIPRNKKEMLEIQGFISWMGMTAGHRVMTVTAWETPEDYCI